MDPTTVRLTAASDDQDIGETLAALGVDDPELIRTARTLAAAEPHLLAALADNPEQLAAFARDPWAVASSLVGLRRPRNAKEVRDAGRFHVAVGDDGPAQAADPAVLELLQRTWQALSADQAATQAFMFDPHATVEAARGNATQQTVDAANRALDIAFGFPPAIPELEIFLVTRNLNVP